MVRSKRKHLMTGAGGRNVSTKVKAAGQQQKRDRMSRAEWLEAALEAMARMGRGPSSIDELVAEIGVTKGSFYWHFESREDFLETLLSYWVEELTIGVVERMRSQGGSAEDRLLVIAENVTASNRAKYDVAMHAWAQREARVAEAVERAETLRLETVRGLFFEMGFRAEELEMRTRTFVVFYSFDQGLRNRLSEEKRLRFVKSRHAMLVGANRSE